MACATGLVAQAAPAPIEDAVEAAYLVKFAPFIEWPPAAFASPDAPFNLCVQGRDPFGPDIDHLAQGQAIGAHPIVVKRVPRLGADSGCQIAYVGGSSAQSPDAALKSVDGQPVLTVTDESDSGADKGIISLVVVGGRMRFMIDNARASRSGLTISSKLLALAVGVRR